MATLTCSIVNGSTYYALKRPVHLHRNGNMSNYFTANTAQELFLEHAGYEFHNTVPGQLLARAGVKNIGYKADGRAAYEVHHWDKLWIEMYDLAARRSSFGQGRKPIKCDAPELPSEVEPLFDARPGIDFYNRAE